MAKIAKRLNLKSLLPRIHTHEYYVYYCQFDTRKPSEVQIQNRQYRYETHLKYDQRHREPSFLAMIFLFLPERIPGTFVSLLFPCFWIRISLLVRITHISIQVSHNAHDQATFHTQQVHSILYSDRCLLTTEQ